MSLDWLYNYGVPTTVQQGQVDGVTELTLDSADIDDVSVPLHEYTSMSDPQEVSNNDNDNVIPVVDISPAPQIRKLPPRENRGRPPRRYSPERVTQPSRYPMDPAQEEASRSLLSTLCQEFILKSVEVASRIPHWRDAMDSEMEALRKNEKWESVSY